MFNPPSPDEELPPPAYTEQEYDSKTSLALQESASIPQPSTDGGWQHWDEEEYQRAAAALRQNDGWTDHSSSSGASSSQPAGSSRPVSAQYRPLPTQPTSPTSANFSAPSNKARPSWYDHAGLGAAPGPIASSSQVQRVDGPSQLQPASSSQALSQHPVAQPSIPDTDDDEDLSAPPPPFVAINPEEIVMRYPGTPSNAPSPLTSPTLSATPLSHRVPSPAYPVENSRQSRYIQPSQYQGQAYASVPTTPTHPIHTHASPLRPPHPPHPQTYSFTSSQPAYTAPIRAPAPPVPHMTFNPSVAYSPQPIHRGPISANAASFYNSAVSAQLRAAPSQPARVAHHVPKPPPPPPNINPYGGGYVGHMQYQNYPIPHQPIGSIQNVSAQYPQYGQQQSWQTASSPAPMRPQSIIAPAPQNYMASQYPSQSELDNFRAELAFMEARNASIAENTSNIHFS